jgi:hypothetical protein
MTMGGSKEPYWKGEARSASPVQFNCEGKERSVAAQIHLESHQDIDHMKLAFVIRLGTDSRPSEGLFEGWVEEVDSCTERRFHSTGELLAFLGQCFDKATPTTAESPKSNKEPPTRKKKNCHQKNASHEPARE